MNSAAVQATLAAVGGDGLWRTNPVWCVGEAIRGWRSTPGGSRAVPGDLRRLLAALTDRGVILPEAALEGWAGEGLLEPDLILPLLGEDPAPGVIGLAVDRAAYVLPFRPGRSPGGWRVDGSLPFLAEDVQTGLAALLRESGVPATPAVPERHAFTFENPLCRPIRGDSMTVAAVLAVLRELEGGHTPLLRAAVALVQFGAGGGLEAVAAIPHKLDAAYRECGRLSLAVVPRGACVDRGRVEVVWEVDTVAELARRLEAANLLAPVLAARGPLTRAEAGGVLDRLRRLVRHEHDYRGGADLGDRVRRCGLAAPADPGVRVEVARLHAEACRHHGRFADATEVSRAAWADVVALGDLGCDDDEADAAAEYAASLFSGHRFGDIPGHLLRWAEAATGEARRFRPLTRVKVWNTLARGLAVLGRDGWDALYRQSLELCRSLDDPENAARTSHYRAHALLRRRDVRGARAAVEEGFGAAFPRPGNVWDAFLRAKLAALEGVAWADAELDRKLAAGERPYSAWVYVQAAARQPARRPDDAVKLLGAAAELLRLEAGRAAGNVCNLFVAFVELDAASRLSDPGRWAAAADSARAFLGSANDHQVYYGPAVQGLPVEPDQAAAAALMDAVPYF